MQLDILYDKKKKENSVKRYFNPRAYTSKYPTSSSIFAVARVQLFSGV